MVRRVMATSKSGMAMCMEAKMASYGGSNGAGGGKGDVIFFTYGRWPQLRQRWRTMAMATSITWAG